MIKIKEKYYPNFVHFINEIYLFSCILSQKEMMALGSRVKQDIYNIDIYLDGNSIIMLYEKHQYHRCWNTSSLKELNEIVKKYSLLV